MKKISKFLSACSALILCTLCFFIFACADYETNEFGNKVYNDGTFKYELLNDSRFKISAAKDNLSGDIVIPSEYKNIPVTAIDNYGFKNCEYITSVTIPTSITYIGTGAFVILHGKLKEIRYEGTFEQYRAIEISPDGYRLDTTKIVYLGSNAS